MKVYRMRICDIIEYGENGCLVWSLVVGRARTEDPEKGGFVDSKP